jgi:sulfite dehydrogenase (quinone) subunit SoeC
MHPAFSVIFLTTLIGTGQGLFLALYTAESYAAVGALPAHGPGFYALGGLIVLVLLGAGLLASFFHLGHPERAWRTASMWRTSWLSREVIVLPTTMMLVAFYSLSHYAGWTLSIMGIETGLPGDLTLLIGAIAVVATFALFVSTAMIYACIKFLAEWATPLTVLNYTLLGSASGFTLATAFAAYGGAPDLVVFYGFWAVVITLAAMVTRVASLYRNARLKPRSSLQTAIGIRHGRIQQRSQGAMGGSFNTREFFHGATPAVFRSVRWVFLVLVFPVPIVLLLLGIGAAAQEWLAVAFVVQYLGLLAERWFFFAQANHPQNLYYQYVS